MKTERAVRHRLLKATLPLALAGLSVVLAGFHQAEAQTWFQPSTPPGRCCAGMVYTHQPNLPGTLLFGGFFTLAYPSPSSVYNDTWILREGGWFQLNPASSPAARFGSGMAYDAATGTVVLFGGTSSDFTNDFNDTWIWDGQTWTQVIPNGDPNSPSGRRFDGQGMTYDAATGTVVLFGGITQSGGEFDETWTWNGTTRTWTQRHPVSHPSARRAPLAYDGATGRVILYGGDDGHGTMYADTWAWDGMNWHLRCAVCAPGARAMPSLAYDPAIRQVVLLGGISSFGPSYNDTWTWNGATWNPTPPTGFCQRYAAQVAYDPVAKGVVLFGGSAVENCGIPQNDTWIFALAP